MAQVKKEEADQVTIKLKKEFPEFRCDVQILREAIYKRFYKERRGSSLIKFRIKWSLSIIADFKKLNMKE